MKIGLHLSAFIAVDLEVAAWTEVVGAYLVEVPYEAVGASLSLLEVGLVVQA